MTGTQAGPDRPETSALPTDRTARFTSRVRVRAREPAFWYVQAGVLLVTLLHAGVEASGMIDRHEGPAAAVAHLPVMLYLLPVVYGGLRYGVEGGVLTGVSIAALSSPNLVIWHRTDWEWLGELSFVALIVAVGTVVAMPVEREKQQRARAVRARERATTVSRRLALMNDVTSIRVRTADLDAALRDVLHRVMGVLDLHTGAVLLWDEDGTQPRRLSCHSVDPDACATVVARVDALCPDGSSELRTERAGRESAHVIPFEVEDSCCGALFMVCERQLGIGELQLIEAIGAQIGVALDNARLHGAEQRALHAYLRDVTRAQEEERRRIARDLHDVATHELLLAKRDLEEPRVAQGERTPTATGAGAERAQQRIADVVDHLRRFSRELRPSVLEPLGLGPALEWLATQADARAEATVRASVRGPARRLPTDVELSLYRIAEEALRNGQQHAGASSIDIVLEFSPGSVQLSVTDDGHGFEVPTVASRPEGEHGLGIIGMQERAALISATLDVTSQRHEGTRVSVHVPTD